MDVLMSVPWVCHRCKSMAHFTAYIYPLAWVVVLFVCVLGRAKPHIADNEMGIHAFFVNK